MSNLTRSFSQWEFECPCCRVFIQRDELYVALQELRDSVLMDLGEERKIKVLSGTRCVGWNQKVGGSKRSHHLTGRAADIVIQGLDPEEMAAYAEDVPAFRHGGIGTYPDNGFIHVDVRGKRARWTG